MNSRIPLLQPHLSGLEEQFVKDAFLENWITTSGNNVDTFENAIKNYCNGNDVICLNSGTSAIHLALILLNIKRDDIVIVQSFSFCASVNPVNYIGAVPVFVDSEEDTWNMNPNNLQEAIEFYIQKNKKPKAIIVTNSYGMPARWHEILTTAREYEIPVIEDAAESLGSKYYGQKCGLFGDLSIFSFNGNKIVTTSSGGALVFNTKPYRNKALHLATQAKVNKEGFEHDQIGYNYRMSNVLAGIGKAQLMTLEDKVNKKRELNEFYNQLLKGKKLKVQSEPSQDFISNFWLNNILFEEEKDLIALKRELRKSNIEFRELWKPLHLQKPFLNSDFFGNGLCKNLYKMGISLPSSTNMSSAEKTRVNKVFKSLDLC